MKDKYKDFLTQLKIGLNRDLFKNKYIDEDTFNKAIEIIRGR